MLRGICLAYCIVLLSNNEEEHELTAGPSKYAEVVQLLMTIVSRHTCFRIDISFLIKIEILDKASLLAWTKCGVEYVPRNIDIVHINFF